MGKKTNYVLRQAYGSKGYTAKYVAEKTGIKYLRFKRIESGISKKGWTQPEKAAISRLLRVPQKILFEG